MVNETNEAEIKKELNVSTGEAPSAGVFRVVRSFCLKVRNGPLISISKGELVELSVDTSAPLFSIGKIEPLELPKQFTVTRKFRTVMNGLYCDLRPGDRLELEKEEALDLWRKGIVKPINSSEVK